MFKRIVNTLVQAPDYWGTRITVALTGDTKKADRKSLGDYMRQQRALAKARALDDHNKPKQDPEEFRKQVREEYKKLYGHYPKGY